MAVIPTTIGSTAGPDNITGTAGVDVVDAGGGSDIVRGEGDDDVVDGGANRDKLYGGDGNDTLDGAGSNDKLYGEGGDDILFGGKGNDRVAGGDGSDKIVGGDGNDVLYGDNAADGNDNEGFADMFFFDEADGSDKVFDFEVGLDQVHLSQGTSYSLAYSGGDTILTYGATTVRFSSSILTDADIFVQGEAGWEATPEVPILV